MTHRCPQIAVVLGIVFGCGTPPASVSSPAASEREPGSATETKPATPPVLPALSNCVLHAGQSDTSARREKKPGGALGPSKVLGASCSFNAECVARRGEDNPGDGFAYLSCNDGHCACRLEALFPAGTVVEWQFQSACTSADQAQELLRSHCLVGVDVAE